MEISDHFWLILSFNWLIWFSWQVSLSVQLDVILLAEIVQIFPLHPSETLSGTTILQTKSSIIYIIPIFTFLFYMYRFRFAYWCALLVQVFKINFNIEWLTVKSSNWQNTAWLWTFLSHNPLKILQSYVEN